MEMNLRRIPSIIVNLLNWIRPLAKKDGLLTTTVVSVAVEKLKNIDFTHLKNYDGADLKPGLKYKYYEANVLSVDELDTFEPKKTRITSNFSIEERDNDVHFGFVYSGYIKISKNGVHTFLLSTNHGGF